MHPLTSLAVSIVTIPLALPSHDGFNSYRLVLVGVVMLLVQFSIGVSNDFLDQQYDSRAKPWKPIPSGAVRQKNALIILASLIISAVALCSILGLLPLGVMLLGLCCGLAYNLGLKRTLLSWLPISLGVPTLLLWARIIGGDVPTVVVWGYPLGLLLGPALNLANQIAGAEKSELSGERSLIHFLGVVKGRRVAVGLFLMAAACMPFVVWIQHLDLKVALLGSLGTSMFVVIFAVLAELGKRLLLWPLAIIIAGSLGISFLLSIY